MKKEPESVQSPSSSSFSGCGAQKQAAAAAALGLGIGVPLVKEEGRRFTAEQRDEFERQVSIYSYIAAGITVPSSLLRPIWKSVSVDNSFRFLKSASGIHGQHPSSAGFDHIQRIDPEPDRCRRTDGKKWRCKKNVVASQKYCQQHMHRGRGRSRKPVESSQTSMNQPRKIPENPNTTPFCSSIATIPSNTSRSVSNVDFKIMGTTVIPSRPSCSKSTSTVHTDSTVTIASIGVGKGSNNCYKSSGIDDMNRNGGTYAAFNHQIDRANAHQNLNNANVCTSQKLNFSPNSVLQVQGGNSGCLSRSGELEPGRCKRTDGKKWRCRRDVEPDEKYCKMHMHRGAKKRVVAPTTTTSGLNCSVMLPSNVYTSNLNTNLSISITANPRLQTKDDSNATSCSSETISDTIVANCNYNDVTS